METIVTRDDHKQELPNKPALENRVSGIHDATDDQLPADSDDKKEDEPLEYGFGVPFSYWKGYEFYPYIAPKYQNLKEELLQNKIKTLTLHQYDSIYAKGTEFEGKIASILGQHGDPNTAFARNSPWLTRVADIKPDQKISLNHILAILFYTNLETLQARMKWVCRRMKKTDTHEDVAKRHQELTVWLRLLLEAITFYGGKLSTNDGLSLYHGLDRKFYFPKFKMKLHIPTSTTAERSMAERYTQQNGVMLEFGGIETEGDAYFAVKSLSLYPEEDEYLFFFAELPIKSLYYRSDRFDCSPLLLYQSIVGGNIIFDKFQMDKKQFQNTQKALNKCLDEIEKQDSENEEDAQIDTAGKYGKALLKKFMETTTEVWINEAQILSNVTMPKLRKKFIKESKKKFQGYSDKLLALQKEEKIQIKPAVSFKWQITEQEMKDGFFGKTQAVCSGLIKYQKGLSFYCQMNRVEKDEKEPQCYIILVLHDSKKKGKHATVSFNLYCKQAGKYYVRFHDIEMKTGKDVHGAEARQHAQFPLKRIENVKKYPIEWDVSIKAVKHVVPKGNQKAKPETPATQSAPQVNADQQK